MASTAKREWTSPKGEKKFGFEVRYKEGGKHRSRTFKLYKQAEAFRKKVEREISDGVHVAEADGQTLTSCAPAFERHLEDRVKGGTLGNGTARSYKSHLRHHVIPLLGHRTFHNLKPIEVHDWFQALTRSGMLKRTYEHEASNRGLSPQTVRRTMNVLSLYFAWAMPRGYAKVNPCEGALKMLGGVRKSRIETFSREDIKAILAALETKGRGRYDRTHALLRCFVHLAVFCGLRLGEIMALTRGNVLPEAGVILVRHSLTFDDVLKEPKSKAGVRDVPVPPHLCVMLRDYIEKHYLPNERDLVFRAQQRQVPFGPTFLKPSDFRSKYWHGLLGRSGVTGKADHFHALRHFAASLMIDEGLPVTEVASLMGHSTFDMTLQVYAHPLVNGHRRRAACEAIATTLLSAPRVVTYEKMPEILEHV